MTGRDRADARTDAAPRGPRPAMVPATVTAARRRDGGITAALSFDDGRTIDRATLHAVGAQSSSGARLAGEMMTTGARVRISVDDGRVLELGRETITMHSATLAAIEASGVAREELARWAARLAVWRDGRVPARRDAPSPHLSASAGMPAFSRRWADAHGRAVALWSGNALRVRAVSDTAAAAMAGRALDEFVELPGLAGLGLTVASTATLRRSGTGTLGCRGAPTPLPASATTDLTEIRFEGTGVRIV